VILSSGLNVYRYVLMRFCHSVDRSLASKAKEGRHIRIYNN